MSRKEGMLWESCGDEKRVLVVDSEETGDIGEESGEEDVETVEEVDKWVEVFCEEEGENWKIYGISSKGIVVWVVAVGKKN